MTGTLIIQTKIHEKQGLSELKSMIYEEKNISEHLYCEKIPSHGMIHVLLFLHAQTYR